MSYHIYGRSILARAISNVLGQKDLSGVGHFVQLEMRSVTQTHTLVQIRLDQSPDEAMNRNYGRGLYVFPISYDAQTDRSRDSCVAQRFQPTEERAVITRTRPIYSPVIFFGLVWLLIRPEITPIMKISDEYWLPILSPNMMDQSRFSFFGSVSD